MPVSHAGKPGRTLEETTAAGRASTASLDEVRTVWETIVFGVTGVTQAMLPLLRKSSAARIVNVSRGLDSLTGISDPACWKREHFDVVYAASKTALNAITMAFAIELEKENIRVNSVPVSPPRIFSMYNCWLGQVVKQVWMGFVLQQD